MGNAIFIYGKSGSGKSRSLKNFAEDEIFLVNVNGKRLPFNKKFKYTGKSADVRTIIDQLQKMPCKTAVIDDAGYIMTDMFMKGHTGGDQFKLYNTIADEMYTLVASIQRLLPDDVNVYLTFHEERSDNGDSKLLTIGKLLDQKICLEGLVTVVLRCIVKGGQHLFITNSDGSDIAKSPEGMFEMEIENDLKMVDDRIREFWNKEED
jgi:hypothetical protein